MNEQDGGKFARRAILSLFAGGTAAALGGCNPSYARRSYRYRLTVEGDYPGSAVYEILAEHTRFVLLSEERPGGSLLKGEALTLETPTGPVFLLLRPAEDGESLISAVTHALAPDIPTGGHKNFWKAVGRLGGWFCSAKADLPRIDWPMMVRFHDVNDPKSVEQVAPQAVGINRIFLETTANDITTGIEHKLAWLPRQTGSFVKRLSVPDPTNPPIAAILTRRDFSTLLPD
tara:strand:- start:4338 stop:5030 length:693 start_codon:yes stop_codon:yes gene_type:complete